MVAGASYGTFDRSLPTDPTAELADGLERIVADGPGAHQGLGSAFEEALGAYTDYFASGGRFWTEVHEHARNA